MLTLPLYLWNDDSGQDIAEYAVMLAVILVLVVGTIRLVGSNAVARFLYTRCSLVWKIYSFDSAYASSRLRKKGSVAGRKHRLFDYAVPARVRPPIASSSVGNVRKSDSTLVILSIFDTRSLVPESTTRLPTF